MSVHHRKYPLKAKEKKPYPKNRERKSTLAVAVGKRISERRRALGLSRVDLAKLAQMDSSLLTDIENGLIEVPLFCVSLLPHLWPQPHPDSDYVYGVIGLFPPDLQPLIDQDRLAVIRALRKYQNKESQE